MAGWDAHAFLLSPAPLARPLNKGGLISREIPVVFIHAWRGSTVSTKVDTYQQQKSVEGGVGPVARA
ncbi:hypothetical protein D7T48_06830 [Stenotrophomonas maltophilia]|nr:hypothetical protein [Stenotrophomonas maltophilia]MBA0411619.1 hypothetical protein [Stenotrophomonas maltophilia]MBA0497280.1 hypothetical protein [Stenotrophomonas maltophilia]MBA0501803.1 hypothetical protein [Stenotrophomonas maltophilia]MBA0505949.1 hypothetical protein [Stenotrophomonas maltophilia]